MGFLDGFRTPVLLVDAERMLALANAAGHDVLLREALLQLRNGRVSPRDSRHEKRFEDLIRSTSSEGLRADRLSPGRPMRLFDANDRVSILGAFPASTLMRFSGASSGIAAQGGAALFLVQPSRGEENEIAQIVFGLTPAEARVADCLMRGTSAPEIARTFDLSRETVKSQIGSIFRKTGTHRQAELVVYLLSFLSIFLP